MKTHMHLALATLLLAAALLSGCAATAQSAQDDTKLSTLLPAKRVDPPAPGENSIWIEFQDQTGQGIDLYNTIVNGVTAKGYEPTNDFENADYVLWATLRIFDKADEDFNERLAGLGAVAGGLATGTAVGSATNSWGYGTAAGVGAGAASGGIVAWATMKEQWAMVVDVQLGKKVSGGVVTNRTSGSDDESISNTNGATPFGAEGGSSIDTETSSQTFTETRTRFELEQRILAYTEGTRMSRDVAYDAMAPRLENSLSSLLPRTR